MTAGRPNWAALCGDELVGGSCGGRAAGGLVVGLGQAGAARLALARNAQTDAGSK